MKFYSQLLAKAGLLERKREISLAISFTAGAIALLSYTLTQVWGLAICLAILMVAIALETIRLRADARQRDFDAAWPQLFDSFQSAAISGVALREQLEYLANRGPDALQNEFRGLLELYDAGFEVDQLMPQLRKRFSNRHADLLALLIELDSELGGHGMAITYQRAAVQVRQEQGELSQLQAKQGWVSASAKLALLAPWLIALVLIQLPQNRAAFATEIGAIVLVTGLALSLFAYALVNRLGQLPLPDRVLNGIE